MAAEFAREYPKVAGRLALDGDGKESCVDPFVERLLEGFAYLTARVQLKFEAEFPRFTQSLLESLYPHYLAPVPSMLVVHFEPDLDEGGLAGGYVVPRNTILRSNIGQHINTACEFRTAHEVTLLPLRLKEAKYYTRDISSLGLPATIKGKAALVLRLEVTAGLSLKNITADRLNFYIRGSGDIAGKIYEQIFAQAEGVVFQTGTARNRVSRTLPASCIRSMGFGEDEALLPPSPRSFEGYRLLREYFAFPQRFLFFELHGIASTLATLQGNTLEIVLPLALPELELENRIDASAFEMFCTPAINLFPKRLDRVALSDRFSEYHVVADRTRPVDYEIFELTRVEGVGSKAGDEQRFTPFYFNYDRDLHAKAYYTVNRVPRVISSKEKQFGAVSYSYTGSELYLTLVDGNNAPRRPDLQQLALGALCTNRHLPIQMPLGVGKTDFYLDISAPIVKTRCISGPSAPIPSSAHGELSWRIISHLSLNYLSLLNDEKQEGAQALREMLRLYAESGGSDNRDAAWRKQVDGLRSVTSKPVIRRVITPGPIAFARGLEVNVVFQESEFTGAGVFVLGSVLEQFFAKYVAINSFTETVLSTVERGEVMRWPAHPGRRHIL